MAIRVRVEASVVEGLIELTKPRQTALLLLTLVASYLAAGGRDLYTLLLASLAGFLTISGTTAVNMVFDRDIDSVMPRTSHRPIPSGRVSADLATLYGIALLLAGLVLAHMVSKLFATLALLGFVFDIPLYTNLAKRRTWLNILVGSGAGAMPAIGGWVAARHAVELPGILLGLMVVAWIPMHIWFIATYYLDDYRRARVPMAPATLGVEATVRLVQASLTVFTVLAWLFAAVTGYGYVSATVTTAVAVSSIAAAERFRRKPARELARIMFKLANPVIAVAFISLAVEGQVVA